MRVTVNGVFQGVALAREKFKVLQILQNGAGRADLVEVVLFPDAFDRFPDSLRGKPVSLPCRVSVREDKRGGVGRLSAVCLSSELPPVK